MRTAQALQVMPAVEQALADGEVTVEHAAAFGEGTWTSLRQARTTAVDAAGLVDDTGTP